MKGTKSILLCLGAMSMELGLAACPSEGVTKSASSEAGLRLLTSSPASGSTVDGPVDELRLQFSQPARLLEIKVSGSAGEMPTMVDSAGESLSYSIPLPGLEAGDYVVTWKASAAQQERAGALSFRVK